MLSQHPFQQKMSKDCINALPLCYYEGEIELIKTPEEQESALAKLTSETVIGFDTETRPAFQKGKTYLPSLVQLAAHDIVFIFHLGWTPLIEGILQVFENKKVIKTGVAVRDDLLGLQKKYTFTQRGFIDLGDIAKKYEIGNSGLRGLAAQFLHVRISKGERCSNWANKNLTEKQIRYAATDAWVSRELFLAMEQEGFWGT